MGNVDLNGWPGLARITALNSSPLEGVVMPIYQEEPKITINGEQLTVGQAMSLRVATSSFIAALMSDGLGDDEHGKHMAEAYMARLREVEQLMVKKA